MLPGIQLILRNYDGSKQFFVSKNNQQHREFFNDTQDDNFALVDKGKIRTFILFVSEYQEGESDLNTYLKGKTIRTDSDYLKRKSLEMRINVERQILRVSSLPNYESVVEIDDPKKIKPATPYRFYLEGLNKKTKITITKLQSVSQFDNLM